MPQSYLSIYLECDNFCENGCIYIYIPIYTYTTNISGFTIANTKHDHYLMSDNTCEIVLRAGCNQESQECGQSSATSRNLWSSCSLQSCFEISSFQSLAL